MTHLRGVTTGGRARKGLIAGAFGLVALLFAIVEIEIIRSYRESSRLTTNFVTTVDSTTFLANVQREFYLYQLELIESPPKKWDEGKAAQRKMFLNRQVDLLSRVGDSETFTLGVKKLRRRINHLNTLIRVGSDVAGGRELKEIQLRKRLRAIELEIKHLFDAEENVLLGTVGETMRGREESQRFLVVMAGLVFVVAVLVTLAFARMVRSRLSQAYTALLETSEEKDRVAADLAESLKSLEIAQAEREGFLDTLLASVEEERMRIAAELHDRPIQQLTALNYDLASARLCFEDGDVTAGVAELDEFEAKLSEQIGGLRKLMSELRPPALDQAGLIGALQDHVDEFGRRTGVRCVVDADLSERPAPQVETVFYRVAQEALTNVMKHAQANNVDLTLKESQDELVLIISDDGLGFDLDPTMKGREHFGMTSMERRVTLAGGRFSVTTQLGHGTKVDVRFDRQNQPTLVGV